MHTSPETDLLSLTICLSETLLTKHTISYSHSVLTPGWLVLALTQKQQTYGKTATKMPDCNSVGMTWLQSKHRPPALEADARAIGHLEDVALNNVLVPSGEIMLHGPLCHYHVLESKSLSVPPSLSLPSSLPLVFPLPPSPPPPPPSLSLSLPQHDCTSWVGVEHQQLINSLSLSPSLSLPLPPSLPLSLLSSLSLSLPPPLSHSCSHSLLSL